MTEVLHANIFFFITGVAVIVVTAIFCVLLFHVLKAIRSLRRILERIEEGADAISEDVRNVRAYFAEDGFVRKLLASLVGVKGGKKGRTVKSERKKPELPVTDEI